MTEYTPLNGREYTRILELFAIVTMFADDADGLHKRAIQAGNNTWRDIQMIITVSRKVLNNLLATVPLKKLEQIKTEMSHAVVYTKVEPPWAKPTVSTKGFCYVPSDALNKLLNEVMDNQCLFCEKGKVEIRHCEIRKTFDDILPHRADGGNRSECQYAGIADGTDMI